MTSKTIAIIGAGPGGVAAAKTARGLGAEVHLIERAEPGGLCLNEGCIPSKTLLEYGRLLAKLKSAKVNGIISGGQSPFSFSLDWDTLQKKRLEVISDLRRQLTQSLNTQGIKLYSGHARFLSGNTLKITASDKSNLTLTPQGRGSRKGTLSPWGRGDGEGILCSPSPLRGEGGGEGDTQALQFDCAIIATGSDPMYPGILEQFKDTLWDSSKALEISNPPHSILIIGGGAVGCEMACLWNECGSRVTIIEKTNGLVPGEDETIVEALQRSFKARGIEVVTGTEATEISSQSGFKLKLANGNTITGDAVAVCIGRKPRIHDLDLETAGVHIEKNYIAVDDTLATNQKNIFAIGDVNGFSKLAHAAAYQGEIAGRNAATNENVRYNGDLTPRCLYTWPEVASIGLTFNQTRELGLPARKARYFFAGSSKAKASGDTEGFIQIIIGADNDKIRGAQIIGPEATELIHILSVAMHAGMTITKLKEVMFAHPSLAEGIREAINK